MAAREQAADRRPTVDELSLAMAAEPVQLKRLDDAVTAAQRAVTQWNEAQPSHAIPTHRAVQRSEGGPTGAHAGDPAAVHRAAAHGTAGGGGALPHVEAIQRAFGRHDVRGVRAFVGGSAAQACRAIGAQAYASGDRVAFSGAPDLHTAAHEAAHVVQQRAGVALKDGVGATGDRYEQEADRVADAVVAGRSAEALLGGAPQREGGEVQRRVQRKEAAPVVPKIELDLSQLWSKGQLAIKGAAQQATWSMDSPEFPILGPINGKIHLGGQVKLEVAGTAGGGRPASFNALLAGKVATGFSIGIGSGSIVRLAGRLEVAANINGIKWSLQGGKQAIVLPQIVLDGKLSATLEGKLWPVPWEVRLLYGWIMKTRPMEWKQGQGFTFDSRSIEWNMALIDKLAELFHGDGRPTKASYVAWLKQHAPECASVQLCQRLVSFCDSGMAAGELTVGDIRSALSTYHATRDYFARYKAQLKAKNSELRAWIQSLSVSAMSPNVPTIRPR